MGRPLKDYNGSIVKGWLATGRVSRGGRDMIQAIKVVDGVEYKELFSQSAWASGRVVENPVERRNTKTYTAIYLDTYEADTFSLHFAHDPINNVDRDRNVAIYRHASNKLTLVKVVNKPSVHADLEALADKIKKAIDDTVDQYRQSREPEPEPEVTLVTSTAEHPAPDPQDAETIPEVGIELVSDDEWGKFQKRVPMGEPIPIEEIYPDGPTV